MVGVDAEVLLATQLLVRRALVRSIDTAVLEDTTVDRISDYTAAYASMVAPNLRSRRLLRGSRRLMQQTVESLTPVGRVEFVLRVPAVVAGQTVERIGASVGDGTLVNALRESGLLGVTRVFTVSGPSLHKVPGTPPPVAPAAASKDSALGGTGVAAIIAAAVAVLAFALLASMRVVPHLPCFRKRDEQAVVIKPKQLLLAAKELEKAEEPPKRYPDEAEAEAPAPAGGIAGLIAAAGKAQSESDAAAVAPEPAPATAHDSSRAIVLAEPPPVAAQTAALSGTGRRPNTPPPRPMTPTRAAGIDAAIGRPRRTGGSRATAVMPAPPTTLADAMLMRWSYDAQKARFQADEASRNDSL